MKKTDLIEILQRHEITNIELEDYNGNTVVDIVLNKFDIADVEGKALRLQLNEESKI